jgi:hypothetical protein
MEIKGIGPFTVPLKPSGKTQPSPASKDPAPQGNAPVRSTVSGGAPERHAGVQAKDLLSDDEQRYLESLFPGATGTGNAAESYAGKGRPGAVPPGTLVDRKG